MALNPMHQFEVYKIGPEINLGGHKSIFYQRKPFYGNKRNINFIITIFGN